MASKQAWLESERSVSLLMTQFFQNNIRMYFLPQIFRLMDQWWIVNLFATQQGGSAKYQRSLHRFTDPSEVEIAAELLSYSKAIN